MQSDDRSKKPASENASRQGDDYSYAIEKILSMAEQREETAPLTQSDLSTLSNLCAVHSSKMKQERLRDDDDMGFADVDTDWICQLVGYLEKHIVAASNIDVIQETYSAIQKIRSKKASFTFDQVRQEHKKKEKFMGDFLKGCNEKY